MKRLYIFIFLLFLSGVFCNQSYADNPASPSAFNTFTYQANFNYPDGLFCQLSMARTLSSNIHDPTVIGYPNTAYMFDNFSDSATCDETQPLQTDFQGVTGLGIPIHGSTINNVNIRIIGQVANVNELDVSLCYTYVLAGFPTTGGEDTSNQGCNLIGTITGTSDQLHEWDYFIASASASFPNLTPDDMTPAQYPLPVWTLRLSSPAQYGSGSRAISLDYLGISFTNDSSMYNSNVSSGGIGGTYLRYTAPRFECGAFQLLCDAFSDGLESVVNGVIGFFVPPVIDTSPVSETLSLLNTKVPFAYTNAIFASDFTFTLPTTMSALPVFSIPINETVHLAHTLPITFNAVVPEQARPLFDWFRTLTSLMIWGTFIAYIIDLAHRFFT